MMNLFEATTGKKAKKVFGKPNAEMVKHFLDKHGITGSDVVVVGD